MFRTFFLKKTPSAHLHEQNVPTFEMEHSVIQSNVLPYMQKYHGTVFPPHVSSMIKWRCEPLLEMKQS